MSVRLPKEEKEIMNKAIKWVKYLEEKDVKNIDPNKLIQVIIINKIGKEMIQAGGIVWFLEKMKEQQMIIDDINARSESQKKEHRRSAKK